MTLYTVTVDKYAIRWFSDYSSRTGHRVFGPAVEGKDGLKMWLQNNQFHRLKEPAIERFSGSVEWWVEGLRHREDGPAIEYADGIKYWYINGVQVSQAEYESKFTVHKSIRRN